MQPGSENVLNVQLVRRETVIKPQLHIRKGFMKNLVKALENDSILFGPYPICFLDFLIFFILNPFFTIFSLVLGRSTELSKHVQLS